MDECGLPAFNTNEFFGENPFVAVESEISDASSDRNKFFEPRNHHDLHGPYLLCYSAYSQGGKGSILTWIFLQKHAKICVSP